MKIIDLSLEITHLMPNHEDDPKLSLTQIKTIKKDGYNDYYLKTNMHTSTHIDGINHMIKGEKISELDLSNFIGVDRKVNLEKYENLTEEIVVIETKGKTLNEAIINDIIKYKIKYIVTDHFTIDDPPYKLHKKLFSHGIMIVENAVNLDKLPFNKLFMVYAIPLKIKADSSLVRLFAIVK